MPNANLTHWVVFHVLLAVLLGVEFVLLRRQSAARAYGATALWIAGAAAFGGYVYASLDHQLAQQFFAGFGLEESLSIDNLFVFLLLFRSFQVRPDKQPQVLFWGILGAVVMRAAFIVAGVELLTHFEWVTYVFAVVLLVAAVRLVLPQTHDKPAKPRWQAWLERKFTFADSQNGFFVEQGGKRAPTVLVLALVAIAFTDFVFALDSIPAVLSITRHTFVAYTSNILAVMGLRSLFFVLAHALEKLKYLHFGLAAVLAFAAIKMLIARWFEFSALASLAIIFSLLLLTVLISLAIQQQEEHAA